MSMWKYKIEVAAKERATQEGLRYGHSIFDGQWYVGTMRELAKIGVVLADSKPLFRVWGTVPYWCQVRADDRASAIRKALTETEFAEVDETDWDVCNTDEARPDALAYIYQCAPCDDEGEPLEPELPMLASAMGQLVDDILPRLKIRAAAYGVSEHEALSYLIGQLESARSSAALSVSETKKEVP